MNNTYRFSLFFVLAAAIACSSPSNPTNRSGSADQGDVTQFPGKSTGIDGGGNGSDGLSSTDTTVGSATGINGADSADGTDGTDDGIGSTDTDSTDVSEPTKICTPDSQQCFDYVSYQFCDATGFSWLEPQPCAEGKFCYQGQCSDVICQPEQQLQQCATPTAFLMCNDVGTHWIPVECPDQLYCYQGQCLKLQCQPGSVTCKGFSAVQECKPDGSGWEITEFCEKGGSCVKGNCVTACEINLKAATYRGCEYYAVDLDNVEGGQKEPVALVVSVPSTVSDATVTVYDTANDVTLSAADMNAASLEVASGTLGIFQLPAGSDIDGSDISNLSYHVKTSSPATVHQFNPLNGDNVYTNDASLLLPSKVGGLKYYIMSWPMRKDEFTTLRGFASIIASEPGETLVTITPRSNILAGPEGSLIKSVNAGEMFSVTLTQGAVLNIETDGEQGSDLTGSLVESDQKVVVFSGHECANIPLGVTACDHIEQQLLPVAAWGNRYIADGFFKRSESQFDVWRIMAGGVDVTIETNPPQKGYEKVKLQAGSFVTFPSSESFEIKGDGPFIVGHYMIGSNYPGHVKGCKNPDTGTESGIGDPALTLAVPQQQYLKEYTVLTPPGYEKNYVNIIAPAGADITIDGQPLNAPLKQVGALQWGIARKKVSTGVHTIKGKKKFGLTSYGYDCDVSYAYPGGLRLLSLEVEKF